MKEEVLALARGGDTAFGEVIRRFRRIDREHKTICETLGREQGLHRSQHMMLLHLAICKSAPTQDEIAAFFEISPAAVATTLKRMEASGLVERRTCPENGRAKAVYLTAAGEHAVRMTRESFASADRAMLTGFSEDELERLASYLKRMQINLSSYAESLRANDETKETRGLQPRTGTVNQ